jgi:hypothetical protein
MRLSTLLPNRHQNNGFVAKESALQHMKANTIYGTRFLIQNTAVLESEFKRRMSEINNETALGRINHCHLMNTS